MYLFLCVQENAERTSPKVVRLIAAGGRREQVEGSGWEVFED